MLEAIRILKTTGLKMRRTVRIGLWTGEEQGLLGSRAYVKQHFADPEVMKPTPEHAKLDGLLQRRQRHRQDSRCLFAGNEMVAPIFSAGWSVPRSRHEHPHHPQHRRAPITWPSMPSASRFSVYPRPSGLRHAHHHSNMDVYERIQEPDMKQMAVIVASFAT